MQALPSWRIQPGVYAMCAATAMLGGVFRASISLVVLLVEGTQVFFSPVLSHKIFPAYHQQEKAPLLQVNWAQSKYRQIA